MPPRSHGRTRVATASCPSGSEVINGGYRIVGPARLVTTVTRNAARDARTWQVTARTARTLRTRWSLQAYAVCVELR